VTTSAPPRVPALLLGVGLGGFVDGIVLHQILQWHHMISSTADHPVTTVAGLQANTFADGLFHLGTWLVLTAGLVATVSAWRRGRPVPARSSQVGLILAGWGLFNIVEGLVDHLVLGLHHVRDDLGGPLSWDLGFLAFGAVLVVTGAALHLGGRAMPMRGDRP
jgi:uncharacterized membrane protein